MTFFAVLRSRHLTSLLVAFVVSLILGFSFPDWIYPDDLAQVHAYKVEKNESGTSVEMVDLSMAAGQSAPIVEGQPSTVALIFLQSADRTIILPDGTKIGGVGKEVRLPLAPMTAGGNTLDLNIQTKLPDGTAATTPYELYISVSPSIFHRFWLGAIVAIIVFVPIFGIFYWFDKNEQRALHFDAKIQTLESKAEREPEKARPAWILAQTKLEAYFDKNLQQVNQVFAIAIVVMVVGFCFIAAAVLIELRTDPTKPKMTAEIVAGGAGVITEFIGATFMVIYRSTMTQANQFMSILERINTVGMTVQVLDSMPENQLKNDTRAYMVELLLLANRRSKSPDTTKDGSEAIKSDKSGM